MKKILRSFGKAGSHVTFGEKEMETYGWKIGDVLDAELCKVEKEIPIEKTADILLNEEKTEEKNGSENN
jgi:hypothetical protein